MSRGGIKVFGPFKSRDNAAVGIQHVADYVRCRRRRSV